MGSSQDQEGADGIEGGSPSHQALTALRWSPGQWVLAGILRYVDELESEQVPAYTELDILVERQLQPGLSIALIGSNLLDDHHPEFGEPDERRETERSLMLELQWLWDR